MRRFLVDHNIDERIIAGFLRRDPGVDCVLARTVSLEKADDPSMLSWAAKESRITISHDVTTMIAFALDRVRIGQKMPGLIVIPDRLAIGVAVNDLCFIAARFNPDSLSQRVIYLPLRQTG